MTVAGVVGATSKGGSPRRTYGEGLDIFSTSTQDEYSDRGLKAVLDLAFVAFIDASSASSMMLRRYVEAMPNTSF